ncbi:ferredoxin/adrenodoxin reductase [Epithele typhae]|uniref:ferredoxin/adrenodoxin reductase n=1 Tax=Epithele typhae TaxID=378194 RepID=UPI0020089722|nr:ferredoxin/adrenodoxin reductase [Epithele typhae]KAH9911353.1 ferredoxin/adrenodoxin reductase [Epithele typhae]
MAPMKLAIVGAGPSAFYVASRLLTLVPPSSALASSINIHMYDRLWAPYGLVRYGVAPDHPEVKNCTHKFDATARDPRLRFFGNVNIGDASLIPDALPVPLESLLSHYTHLLFASGSPVPTLHPALPPSPFCLPALSLVHWYTQHPSRPAAPPPLERTKHVTIIGQGNVALDVARMLLTPPDHLARFDVPEPVLSVLRASAVEHVSVVGRRGPLQAAFTAKELREMLRLPNAAMAPLPAALLQPPPGVPTTRQQTRLLQLLSKGPDNAHGSAPKSWALDFFRQPTGLLAPRAPGNPSARPLLTLAHTALDASHRAVPTGETSALHTDLVVTALGHRAEPGAPWADGVVGGAHVRTRGARVVDAGGRLVRRVYASGWAAHGARGVLATTMMDAYAAAETVLRDQFPDAFGGADEAAEEEVEVLPRAVADLDAVPPEVVAGVEAGKVTQFGDWEKIDAEEVARGKALDKERERMVSWQEAREFLARTRA